MEEEEEEEEYKGIQRKAKQQLTFWSFQGCLVTTANYLQGSETGQYRRRLLPTHHSLQLSLAWKIVWKSTMQYGKTFTGKDGKKFCYSPYNGELYMSI